MVGHCLKIEIMQNEWDEGSMVYCIIGSIRNYAIPTWFLNLFVH